MASFGTRVGPKRSIDPTRADYARQVHQQMRGVQKNLAAYIGELRGLTQQVLLDALTPTFNKSQEYCPVDTGRMKASGYLEVVGRGKNIKVEIGYGKNASPPYTAMVHERTDIYHKPPTKAKWLQIALQEDMDNIKARIVAGLQHRKSN